MPPQAQGLAPPPPWRDVPPTEWDAYDHVCVLGLESLQKRRYLVKAPTLPRGHKDRKPVIFPDVMNRTVDLHQLEFVTKYYSAFFAGSDDTSGYTAPYLLCDGPGLGKTTTALMVAAYYRWIVRAADDDIHIPLMEIRVLKNVFKLHIGAVWETIHHKPILVVTLRATVEQFCDEIGNILNPSSFNASPFSDMRSPMLRATLYKKISDYVIGKSKVCPIVVISWTDLDAEDKLLKRFRSEAGGRNGGSSKKRRSLSRKGKGVARRVIRVTSGDEDDGDDDDDRNETARLKAETLQKAQKKGLYGIEWASAVLDEAQEAREPLTRKFQSIGRLTRNAHACLVMTATPLWNKPLDLLNILRAGGMSVDQELSSWDEIPRPQRESSRSATEKLWAAYQDCHRSILDLVSFSLVLERERQSIQRALKALPSSHNDFASEFKDEWELMFPHGDTKESGPLKERWERATTWVKWVTEVILHLANGRVVRRPRSHLQAFHPVVDTELPVNLSPELRAAYQKLCIKPKNAETGDDGEYVDSGDRGSATMSESFPAGFDHSKRVFLIDPAAIDASYRDLGMPKVDAVIKLCKQILREDRELDDEEKRKIAVFCEWAKPDLLHHIKVRFSRAGIPIATLNGRMSEAEKQNVVLSFRENEDHPATNGRDSRILLFSNCVSAGVNLQRASVLIILDNAWSFAKREQVEGRILRMGQTRPVSIYRVVVPNTIDEGILFTQLRKKHLIDEMEKQWHTSLSTFAISSVLPSVPKVLPPSAARKRRKRVAKKGSAKRISKASSSRPKPLQTTTDQQGGSSSADKDGGHCSVTIQMPARRGHENSDNSEGVGSG